MITRTIFAGFGGQGILVMGYVLAHGAMARGLELTYLPAYGAEMRGGTANCTVVVSDEPIASPVASEPDILVAMNQPSLDRFGPMVRAGGLIMINESLIDEGSDRTDVSVILVPTLEPAREAGSERAANMVMAGAFFEKTGLLTIEEAGAAMEKALKGKEKYFKINHLGLARGAEYIRTGH